MGVGNTVATVPSFLSPKITAALLPAWESVFFLVAGIASVVSLGYSALCSAEAVDVDDAAREAKKDK